MYSWRNWPLKDEPPWKTLLLALSVAGSGIIAGVSFAEPLFGLISFLLLALSVGNYWIPSHYTLDESGVKIKRLWSIKQRAWHYYKRAASDSGGVFLGVFISPSPLDSFRGDYLRCPGKVAEIYEFAKRHIH